MNKNNRLTCNKLLISEIHSHGKINNDYNLDYSYNEEK